MAQTPVSTWFLLLLLGSSIAGNSTCRKVGPPSSRAQPQHVATAHVASICVLPAQVRFATFNTSLNRNADNELLIELRAGVSAQAANVSAILQSIRPDVVILNEFDYVADEAAIRAFQHNFLSVSQAPGLEPLRQVRAQSTLSTQRGHPHPHNGTCLTLPDWGFPTPPCRYPYVFTAPVNTGVPSSCDFDHDGKTDGPADAFGYGLHPGEGATALAVTHSMLACSPPQAAPCPSCP